MNRWARIAKSSGIAFRGLVRGSAGAGAAASRNAAAGFRAANPRPANPRPATPDPQLQPNPLEALRNLEPPINEEYRLGRGDEITVDFAGRPDLQAKLVVGPDGRITLPLAGDILLDGLTRSEASKAIAAALASYYDNLAVQVTVTKYTANRVLVLGAVTTPGEVTFAGHADAAGGADAQRTFDQDKTSPPKFPSAAPSIAAATRWCGCS